MDLGRSGLLSQVSSVRLGSLGFGEENPPSDPPKLVFGGEDPLLTVTGNESTGFWSAQAVWSGGLVFDFRWTTLDVVEALVVARAISFALEIGCSSFILEGDSKIVINTLNSV